MFTDYIGNKHTEASLQKRLEAVPAWFWQYKNSAKYKLEVALKKGNLELVADSLEFIEYKIEDWATD